MIILNRKEKIMLTGFGISVWYCPKCKGYIKSEYDKFCANCGEKIMWEDD